ncbi:ribonuclease H2, subunit C [Xylaria bambusicola]|uniref:ribonuclease H2, subunit C n=1 Tax=Xylaria bambusicola TaxID=326684 RepID=UPI00200841E8|nr:ribonuclease H2, subunit C [Xylaria bambusicola]KAI0516864.1 ribonuclease H2, subunit C [Xylaria bambusicola]
MAPPLFAIESEGPTRRRANVNLLPCRIHHDGDVNPSSTFWNPTQTSDEVQTAYLRGRKLHGKAVKLPEGYHGVVVEKTDAKPQTSTTPQEMMDEDVEVIESPDEQLEVGTMRGKAAFDELMIWGHESTSDSTVDPFVRGMEEWIAFAEEIHSPATDSESSTK